MKPDRFSGDINTVDYEDEHPFILRDPNKCILCGVCVRVCDEVMGVGALGLVKRGFDTVVKPALEQPLAETGCISCGQCTSYCPTGALQERMAIKKSVPLDTTCTQTTCSHCSVGCSLELENYGDLLIKAVPDKEGAVNKGILCGKGKFGFDCAYLDGKLLDPMAKDLDGMFTEVDYHDAFVLTAKKTEAVAAKYGKDAVAVAISDRYTNEEAYVMKKLAESIGAKTLCFDNRESGIEKVLGVNASPNTIDELLSTEVILVVGFNNSQVMRVKLSQAAKNGAKVILINPEGYEQDHFAFAYKTVYTQNDLSYLQSIAKVLTDMGKGTGVEGYEEFAKSVATAEVTDEIKEIAELYANAKKAMMVFQQNLVSVEAATLLADIAVVSGHIGKARDGILQIKAKNNSQGLIDLGITAGAEAMDGVKALLVFGEDVNPELLKDVEFMMVCDTHMTETARRADVVIPGTGFASADGTYTNTERRLQAVEHAIEEEVVFNNWEVAAEIAHVYEVEMPYDDEADIAEEMDCTVPVYREAVIGEVHGAVLACKDAKLVAVAAGKFVDPLKCTDNLTNMIEARLPKCEK